jgi:hypothetical protein
MTDLRLKLASTLPALKLQIATPRFTAQTLPYLPGTLVGGAGIDVAQVGTTYTIAWNATEAGFSAFGMQFGGAVDAAAALALLGTIAVTIASQAEAESGVENSKMMTPLRTAQAVDDIRIVARAFLHANAGGL